MSLFFPAVFFVFGAIVASFVGVLVARLYTGQSFVVGRSKCDACGSPLTSLMLVPIFSHLASGGRAHCCGTHLSFLSPATELLLGVLFAFGYVQLGFTVALPFMFLSLALLTALVLYDLAHQILPTSLLAAFVLSSALTGFFLAPSPDEFYTSAFVALLIGGSLMLVHLLSHGRAMGFSDAPFVFGLSLMVGPAALSGFIFSFWIGAVIGILILLKRPRGSRMGGEVPFAPFLAAGFLLAYFTQWNPFIFIASLPGL
ncbi:MAG: prepilin peptidase [Candidatus Paceibacterota bacterium]|jgi:leader peptidase (prepilin peptidase)/N-methyltransferase